jgi:hypothetical protein
MSEVSGEGKKRINKVFLFTSLLNYVIGVAIFFLPTYGFPYLKGLPNSEGWQIAYQPFTIGFLISLIGFTMILRSLFIRKISTPELIAARKVSNKVLIAISGLVLCIALYETLLVAGVLR